MNSIRKMRDTGEVKRADGVQVRYESLHIEPGFNLRQDGAELEESIEALALHIIGGGKFPPLEVRPRDEGGMWIVDGHRRHAAIGRALERGAPLRSQKDGEAWIHVVLFEGNEEDRIARIITSANNKPLAPAEIAEGYKRLRAFNWTPAQIAKKVGKSVQHVQDLLALGDAPSPVRAMVKAGQVSATRAAKAVRKHGEKSSAVLGEQWQEAQAKGKSKITAATTDQPKASASDARADSKRLDFLIEEGAIVVCGGKVDLASPEPGQTGYWLKWPRDDIQQPGVFETPRQAIDTAIKQKLTK
ncbi:ParB/RepB/Spo0J family partition protein [Delftia sp. PS-11]|uniref:ParB/RepB/Spo0J family partition protein n=1 Tax=Delftia sp. PS-11 TaxID=2767222 RepID=UPI00245470A0|nr:ParB N-terminal domain-containing protein [Delftia sp. PS-11]KAJ8743655.1 ParB N-terminal domain-containing protein [Delftia sp. PS-11]